MSENKNTSSGVGFTGLLLIAFIVLKLCNVINWTWFWVLSPVWIPVVVAVAILIPYGIYLWRKSVINERKHNDWLRRRGIEPNKSKWQQRMEEMQKTKNGKS